MKTFFEKNTIPVFMNPVNSPLQCAAEHLRKDLEQVFTKPVEQASLEDAELVVMTYDQVKEKPVWKEKVRAGELLDENGKPIWEGYLLAVEGSQLWIVGSDTRGTIYGIYDLTRRIGVSPWYFFADVPVKKEPLLDCRMTSESSSIHPSSTAVFSSTMKKSLITGRKHIQTTARSARRRMRIFLNCCCA